MVCTNYKNKIVVNLRTRNFHLSKMDPETNIRRNP